MSKWEHEQRFPVNINAQSNSWQGINAGPTFPHWLHTLSTFKSCEPQRWRVLSHRCPPLSCPRMSPPLTPLSQTRSPSRRRRWRSSSSPWLKSQTAKTWRKRKEKNEVIIADRVTVFLTCRPFLCVFPLRFATLTPIEKPDFFKFWLESSERRRVGSEEGSFFDN